MPVSFSSSAPVGRPAGAARPASPPRSRLTRPALTTRATLIGALGLCGLLGAGAALRLLDLDVPLFLALNGWFGRWPAAELLWSALSVTGLGLSAFLLVTTLCSTTHDPARLQPLAALLWGFVVGGLLTHGLKRLLAMPRPPAVLAPEQFHLIGEALQRGSMPSGHAITAFATLVIVLGCWRLGRLAQLGAVLVAVGVAAARIACAAHWPSDVLAGAGIGLLSGWIALQLAEHLGRRLPDGHGWLLRGRGVPLALLQCSAGVAMCLIETGYPAAVPVQWLYGSTALLGGLLRLAVLLPARPLRARRATAPTGVS